MQLPRWLRVVTVLIVLNALVVSWSVIQRHVLASTRPQEDPEVAEQQSLVSDQEEAKDVRVDQSKPALPPPEVLESNATVVPPDDPLLNEIRKQAASQFGELRLEATMNPEVDPGGNTNKEFRSRSTTDLQLLQERLQVVASLNEATMKLTQMASLQQHLGETAQAEATLSRTQQLMWLMRDLLNE